MAKLTESLKERQEVRRQSLLGQENINHPIPIPEEQEEFLKDVHKQIEEFLAGDDEQMELGKCNGFQRRLIYQTARDKYKQLSLSSVNNANGER